MLIEWRLVDDASPIPRLRGALDYGRMQLDAEEGYLLSRIDGATSVKALGQLTGLPPERVRAILDRLEAEGAIEVPAPAGSPPGTAGRREETGVDAREAGREDDDADADGDDDADGDADDDADASHPTTRERTATLRRLFQADLAPLDTDARVARAREAEGDLLLALCFDPHPRVIQAVLDREGAGLEHARLVAAHHRTATGLGHLGTRAALLRDRQVQRLLFRNPQIPDLLFSRAVQAKRMADVYRLALSRDVTERVKANARKAFREKFRQGTAEERVALLFSTEARCLNLLVGLSLDGRSASLLIGRPIHSTLFVQNLARWPATPPNVLVHLAKQPLVQRAPALKTLLQRHPNAPSQLKRG
jgi:hypothetical protein